MLNRIHTHVTKPATEKDGGAKNHIIVIIKALCPNKMESVKKAKNHKHARKGPK